ncbi:putative leader peptide [Streptacidiphilus sp. P02-A3a]|nr:putative leader peptide [Streptacidiphilus sp. P02-A3a]
MRTVSVQDAAAHPRPGFQLLVLRRHVDLLRVSSALCPEDRSAR